MIVYAHPIPTGPQILAAVTTGTLDFYERSRLARITTEQRRRVQAAEQHHQAAKRTEAIRQAVYQYAHYTFTGTRGY